ncbi:unnamed protein product [Musa acuminata subsp. malaccensis]|uniref:(wild Malaysian banana) hypothetical protein n=1 Tax=Musa acuminata subsp. malaccensis TaxID=214687 RepID=A0A804KDF9_MUSAM|nr:unnamed protein product [Musa acuminata subsp. malaccensis]
MWTCDLIGCRICSSNAGCVCSRGIFGDLTLYCSFWRIHLLQEIGSSCNAAAGRNIEVTM